jgi:hypothetical protein
VNVGVIGIEHDRNRFFFSVKKVIRDALILKEEIVELLPHQLKASEDLRAL